MVEVESDHYHEKPQRDHDHGDTYPAGKTLPHRHFKPDSLLDKSLIYASVLYYETNCPKGKFYLYSKNVL